uniref:Uncharacterized protein n=1 Tax=Branchiostoma floridae TaxID=7739 RepID=C3Z196_BRAFL|eukprot:XP_002597783.1 hypothetical protein BRAFLDRAFT_77313 [Branchiostoma floridae]
MGQRYAWPSVLEFDREYRTLQAITLPRGDRQTSTRNITRTRRSGLHSGSNDASFDHQDLPRQGKERHRLPGRHGYQMGSLQQLKADVEMWRKRASVAEDKRINGLNINTTYANDTASAKFLQTISDSLREKTAGRTSSSLYISFMIDGDTDVILYLSLYRHHPHQTDDTDQSEQDFDNEDEPYAGLVPYDFLFANKTYSQMTLEPEEVKGRPDAMLTSDTYRDGVTKN